MASAGESGGARYLFVVSMDVAEDKEALFNEVYDTEHVPYLKSVPGVLGARRSVRELASTKHEEDHL